MADLYIHQLLASCQHGDLQCLEDILNSGVHPDFELDCSGNTSLQVAAASGQARVVVELLKRCATVDCANHAGWTPLLHAAYHGHTAVVDILLCNNAKINEPNKFGLRPLIAAVCGGHSATVHLLLEAGALVDPPEPFDFTPLMASALYGHEDIACLLLDRGASVNQAASPTKVTPLMMAACGGSKAIAQRLVECGADTNAINVCGQTALDVAVACDKWEVKAYLNDKTHSSHNISASKSIEEEMIENIKQGNETVVKNLVERDPKLASWCDSDGATPLMEAALAGNVELVKFFIQKGSALDQQDKKNGWTALMQAVYHEHTDVIQYLLAVGSSVDVMAFDGYTALDLAWLLEKPDIAQFLLQWKAEQAANLSSGSLRVLTPHKPSVLKNTSFRQKQSNNAKIKNLLGNFTSRIQIFKCSRPSTPITPARIDANENNISLETVTNKASPMTMLKLSSFHLQRKEASKEVKLWDMPLNLPQLPSLDIPKAMKSHLSPKSGTPKPELHAVHLLKKYHQVREYQDTCIGHSNVVNSGSNISPPSIKQDDRNTCTAKTPKPATIKCGKDILHSSVDNVDDLLHELSLDRYVEKMKHHEIDLESFKTLTKDDLIEIGVSYGPQQQLLSAIKSLTSGEDV